MDKINQLAGSVDLDEFIRGLLLSSEHNSLGEQWDKCTSCPLCAFKEQCEELGKLMEAQGKNPTCSQVIDILLGDLSPDSEKIPPVPYFDKIQN